MSVNALRGQCSFLMRSNNSICTFSSGENARVPVGLLAAWTVPNTNPTHWHQDLPPLHFLGKNPYCQYRHQINAVMKHHKIVVLNCCIHILDIMQRSPRLSSYSCTALAKWSPRIRECTTICALQRINCVHNAVVRDGGCHYCCCIDTWHVKGFTCQTMSKVGLKPLEILPTNSTSISRRWHVVDPCWWLRLSAEWWEQNTNVLLSSTKFINLARNG